MSDDKIPSNWIVPKCGLRPGKNRRLTLDAKGHIICDYWVPQSSKIALLKMGSNCFRRDVSSIVGDGGKGFRCCEYDTVFSSRFIRKESD